MSVADYVYRKIIPKRWYSRLKIRSWILLAFLSVIGISVALITIDLNRSNKTAAPVSGVRTIPVEGNISTFRTDYFTFTDTGKWVLNKNESTTQKYIYYKYHGQDIQYQLIVYVNQVPIPLYLATSRALPVRIVNDNSFDVTSVSGPCVGQYGQNELHKVRQVNINGADMLCDPDTPQYTVVFAEVSGNYQLKLKRQNGTPINFVITFRDLTLDPGPEDLLRIANSFQSQ